ncbi:myogenesis-regulating glycosidase-like [Cylas formicarius]|uniref:myogenesis-regulating glycosidase-like n=1 Tax=Cylas formicarius TaxID=197179 RepID=UPI002958C548|nr:myogenesis-regulating glycosidase-like [Cylas formicarius]
MDMYTQAVFCAILLSLFVSAHAITWTDTTGTVTLYGEEFQNGLLISLQRNGVSKLTGQFGSSTGYEITPIANGFEVRWTTNDLNTIFEDRYDLNIGSVNWYGGPQRYEQNWPIEKMSLSGDEAYVIKKTDNFGVAERYWLNSKGAYIYLDEEVPLFVDHNSRTGGSVYFTAKVAEPYVNRTRVILSYKLIARDDPKEAHLDAINNYLGKPVGHPDERMIREPIWTTWAQYKRDISDSVVIQFADEIRSHGYDGGQIEIDDQWEAHYGDQTFKTDIFTDINQTVRTLKDKNFRVTLWVHPFVDDDSVNVEEGKSKGYFVKNPSGDTNAVWWDSNDAHQIDFTYTEAAAWWSARLKSLQTDYGIDAFKFDAGETNYVNQPAVYEHVEDVEQIPNILTKSYIETCEQFGNLIEVRASWRTQASSHFIRMLDKDSNWSYNNGLPTLVTTLLQMNLNGYVLVLPDMIGGNGYNGESPTGEMIIRWAQANTFMPAMQFSYLPWNFKDSGNGYDVEAVVKKYVDLHARYSPQIVEAMEKSIATGEPVNKPIWWLDPTDSIALANFDEYLLGDDVLVAPVLVEHATSRSVYLPKGNWTDANGVGYVGPVSIDNYAAPVDVLPYFIRSSA